MSLKDDTAELTGRPRRSTDKETWNALTAGMTERRVPLPNEAVHSNASGVVGSREDAGAQRRGEAVYGRPRRRRTDSNGEVTIAEYVVGIAAHEFPIPEESPAHKHDVSGFSFSGGRLDGDAGALLIRVVNALAERLGREAAEPFVTTACLDSHKADYILALDSNRADHLLRFLVHAALPDFLARLPKLGQEEKDRLRQLLRETSTPNRESKLQRERREAEERERAEAERERVAEEKARRLRETAEAAIRAEEEAEREARVQARMAELAPEGG